MYRKNKRQGNRQPKNRNRQNRSNSYGVLTQIVTNPARAQKFRFQNTTAGQSRINVTRGQALFWLAFNISTTVQQPLFSSIQIKRIRIIGTTIADTASVAANNTIDLIWGGSLYGNDMVISSTSNAMTRVATIVSSPPKNSSAAAMTTIFGVNSGSSSTAVYQGADILFSVVAQTGSLIEIDTMCHFNDTPTTLSLTTSGLTAGVPTWNSMDNIFLSGATHVWDPLGHRDFTQ
jgi:hypothetical protein